ncbi:MetS family NSS transporter small subunit [Oceanisphaera pacifica]|uniref:MetS family NSS transporter small subunit n=1 Tax=Oceanisphaera pacifica TaxID=2818389 RepID=A0ABS3NDX3_9GAMM|nr:MetS family NSS transporter small subunit [Oceanisphaera pacifica]MBO1518750.1 MetS family NSS transporter small subunit [Oceanisphaera pacifica]
MSLGAIIMLLVGLGLTWGGAVLCIRLAMKTSKS